MKYVLGNTVKSRLNDIPVTGAYYAGNFMTLNRLNGVYFICNFLKLLLRKNIE